MAITTWLGRDPRAGAAHAEHPARCGGDADRLVGALRRAGLTRPRPLRPDGGELRPDRRLRREGRAIGLHPGKSYRCRVRPLAVRRAPRPSGPPPWRRLIDATARSWPRACGWPGAGCSALTLLAAWRLRAAAARPAGPRPSPRPTQPRPAPPLPPVPRRRRRRAETVRCAVQRDEREPLGLLFRRRERHLPPARARRAAQQPAADAAAIILAGHAEFMTTGTGTESAAIKGLPMKMTLVTVGRPNFGVYARPELTHESRSFGARRSGTTTTSCARSSVSTGSSPTST